MYELMSTINAYLISEFTRIKGFPTGQRLPAGHDFPGVTFPSTINEDSFSGDSQEELICRHDVSPLVVRRYLTGGFWAQFSFSYYCKSMEVILARQTLEAIEAVLFIDNFTDLLGLPKGRLDVVARPTFVSKEESGASIYTSSYRLVYFQEVSI